MENPVIKTIETVGPFFAYLRARIVFVHDCGWEILRERHEAIAVVTVIGVVGLLLLQRPDWDQLLGKPIISTACVWMGIIVLTVLRDALLLPRDSFEDDR